jgi:hypothetical protein
MITLAFKPQIKSELKCINRASHVNASHVYERWLAFALGLNTGPILTKGELMPRPRRSQVSVELFI